MTKLNLHKTFVLMILTLVTLASVIPMIQPTYALSTEVPIAIPSYPVQIDGQTRENTYHKYPVILYKEITYFPLTYYDCMSLGLNAVWTAKDGLTITNREGEPFPLKEQNTGIPNPKTATATIVNFPVRIMGTMIDNSKEKYPLLLYRNITYIPWTWDFAKELGALYRFDATKGLRILSHNFAVSYPRIAAEFTNELYHSFSYEGAQYTVEVDYPSIGMPWPNNLLLTKLGEKPVSLGDAGLYYGILTEQRNAALVKYISDSLRIEAPWIYVHATSEDGAQNGLFRVHIITGETSLVEPIPLRKE